MKFIIYFTATSSGLFSRCCSFQLFLFLFLLHVVHADGEVDWEDAVEEVDADEREKLPIVVVRPDAIAEPEAVMVEPFDAFVTLSAVFSI